MRYTYVYISSAADRYSYHFAVLEWSRLFFLCIQMHIPIETTVTMTQINPAIMEMIAINETTWFWRVPTLGVVEIVEGVSIWHSDWVSAGTNRSHSKSTAYELSFKKRAGFDRYQFLRAVYNCFVWAALLVLMVPKNTVAPSTSLLQNEWVMVTEEEEMLWHTAPEKEMVYIKMFCSSSSNCDVVCCKKSVGRVSNKIHK